jgi:hypothetical protein
MSKSFQNMGPSRELSSVFEAAQPLMVKVAQSCRKLRHVFHIGSGVRLSRCISHGNAIVWQIHRYEGARGAVN